MLFRSVDEGHVVLLRELRQLGAGDFRGETRDRVIRRMRLEDDAGLRTNGFLEIAQVGAIGGADLVQFRAGALHHFRQAKRAADFDELAARDDGFLAARVRGEGQQHGGGIVVDDAGVFRAGEFAHQTAHVIIALAARGAADVEFEIGGMAHRGDDGFDGFLGERGAAEVRVQHGAREVEHAALRGRVVCFERGEGGGGEGGGVGD